MILSTASTTNLPSAVEIVVERTAAVVVPWSWV
jgi:hypothetical protein